MYGRSHSLTSSEQLCWTFSDYCYDSCDFKSLSTIGCNLCIV